MQARRHPTALLAVILIGLAVAACGRPSAGRAPTRGGEVWELDRAAGRPAMPGAVLAYVNGLHLIVVDGNDVYAGMTPLKAETRDGGARALHLANGLDAVLTPAGDGRMRLSFSSGESVDLVHKPEAK